MRNFINRNPLVILIPVLILGLTLRVYRIDLQPLWFDEGYSVYFSTTDLVTTTLLTAQDIHPPLYYYLLGLWIRVFGLSDVSLRALSVAVGTATIPFVYFIGQRLFRKSSIALTAAFLLAISPMHVYYSQEVRMYGLVTLLVSISLYFLSSIAFAEKKQWYNWLGFIAMSVLAIHTQYFAAFLLAAFAIFFLVKSKDYASFLKGWWISFVAIILSFLPWAALAGLNLVNYVGGKVDRESYSALNPISYFGEPLLAFSNGNAAIPIQLLGLTFIGIAAVNGVSFSLKRQNAKDSAEKVLATDHNAVLFALLLVTIPLLLGWIINLKFPFHPQYWERLFLFSLPAFLLLVATGIDWAGRKFKPAFLFIAILIVLFTGINSVSLYGFYTTERYAENDYRPLVKLVSAHSRPDDLVLLVYPWQVGFFQTYLESEWPRLQLAPVEQWSEKPRVMANDIALLAENHNRVWFPSYQVLGRILEAKIEDYFVRRQYPISENWFGDTRLFQFSTGQLPPQKEKLVNFDDTIRLLNYHMSQEKVESGSGSVNILLNWRAVRRLQDRYTVNLRLVDDMNHTWAQRDSEPVTGHSPSDQWDAGSSIEDRHGLLIPAGTPPGEYAIKLGLTSAKGRLNVLDENNAPSGQEIGLGKVTVFPSTSRIPISALFIEQPFVKDMGHGITLLGFSGGEGRAKPGTTMRLSLFWQVTKDFTEENLPLFFWFENGEGNRFGEVETKPVSGKYPTETWTPIDLVRDQQDILLPANMPDGTFTLMVGLGQKENGTALFAADVQGRPHNYEKPVTPNETSLKFGDFAELIGYDIEARPIDPDSSSPTGTRTGDIAVPGDKIVVTLYWHVIGESTRNLAAFVHLLGPGNQMVGQRDSVPGNGTLPTTSWVRGEFLIDTYEVDTKLDTPDLELGIEIGMYDPSTGQRLSVQTGDGAQLSDSQIVGKIRISPDASIDSSPVTSSEKGS